MDPRAGMKDIDEHIDSSLNNINILLNSAILVFELMLLSYTLWNVLSHVFVNSLWNTDENIHQWIFIVMKWFSCVLCSF